MISPPRSAQIYLGLQLQHTLHHSVSGEQSRSLYRSGVGENFDIFGETGENLEIFFKKILMRISEGEIFDLKGG